MKYLIILLFSTTVFAQSKPIEIKIDSITSSNIDDGSIKFTLQYHITNLSEKPVSFVLNTNSLIPIGTGSLIPAVYYKLYEKESSVDVSGIFTITKGTRYFKDEAEYKRFADSLTIAMKNRTPEDKAQKRKELFLNNIQTFKANETKHFTEELIWDKNRYHRNDDIEYYIEEKEKHYLELHINLMTEELLLNFSEEEKKEVLKDKILTKGWFTSNKIEIDLSE